MIYASDIYNDFQTIHSPASSYWVGKVFIPQTLAYSNNVRPPRKYGRYARAIPQWQRLGYHVKLIFLDLPDVEAALARQTRTAQVVVREGRLVREHPE